MTAACTAAFIRFSELTSDINVYDVYGICYSSGSTNSSASKNDKFKLYDSKVGLTKLGNEIKTYKKSWTAKEYTPWAFPKIDAKHNLKELPPCTFGDPIIAYFNRADVRSLLHIPTTV